MGKAELTVDDVKLRLPAANCKDRRMCYFVIADLEVAYASKFPI